MASLWTTVTLETGDLSQFSSTTDTAANTSATASGTAAYAGSYGMLVTSAETGDNANSCYGQMNFTDPSSGIIRVEYWWRQDYDSVTGYNSATNAKAHFELGSAFNVRAALAFINRANGDLNLGITNDSFARVNLASWTPSLDTWYLIRVQLDYSGASLAYLWQYSTDGTNFTTIINSTTTSHRFDNDGSDYARFGHIHINQWERSTFSEWFDNIAGYDDVASSGTTYNQSAAGSLAPAGAMSRSPRKALAGSAAPSGTVRRLTGKNPAGALTPTGAAQKTTSKNLAGTVSLAGVLAAIRTAIVSAGGDLGLTGTLAMQTMKSVAGSLSPSGTLARRVDKVLAGALAPVGALATLLAGLYTQAVGGTLAMSGALVRSVSKSLSGALAPSGTLAKLTSKILAGALGLAGSMVHNLFGPSAWLADVTLADDLTYTVALDSDLTYTVAIGNSLTYTVALEDEPA